MCVALAPPVPCSSRRQTSFPGPLTSLSRSVYASDSNCPAGGCTWPLSPKLTRVITSAFVGPRATAAASSAGKLGGRADAASSGGASPSSGGPKAGDSSRSQFAIHTKPSPLARLAQSSSTSFRFGVRAAHIVVTLTHGTRPTASRIGACTCASVPSGSSR